MVPFNWRLHEDLGRPNTYRVEMMYRAESAIDSRDCQNDHDGGDWDTKSGSSTRKNTGRNTGL
jgi:hypothetical protein